MDDPIPGQPTTILITREPFGDWFTLTLPNGHTEELEPDPCRQWFKERGAKMDAVEKVLDHVWNFQRANINIANFREPVEVRLPHSPKL